MYFAHVASSDAICCREKLLTPWKREGLAAGILTNAWVTSPWLDCAENNPPWIFVAAAPTLTLSHGEEGLGQAGMRTEEGLIILVDSYC